MRLTILLILFAFSTIATATEPNRLAYLNDLDPYYVHGDFPKLVTQQWIGEPGVDAVAVLSIDDMRDHQKYEAYLRPIIDRLKQIDGRAPVSIFTCFVQPDESHFQTWLDEGLNIDIHTVRHPCPLMDTSDFDAAKDTYDQCVDVMNAIPRNRPVAFRMPCCDSLNTPSPRFYNEIFAKTTGEGATLTIDSSVFNIMKENANLDFRKYIPFDSYVNTIEDYPYPYLIGSTCIEIPCTVPSDWEGHNIQGSDNPVTVDDMKHAIDLTVDANGVYVLVFHPHGWIENTQVVSMIDHAVAKHGTKIKFLQFAEIEERIRKNLFKGHPLRKANGEDNGIRLLDVNNDGFMDVIIANEKESLTRVWEPGSRTWQETPFPPTLVTKGDLTNVHIGAFMDTTICFIRDNKTESSWKFENGKWNHFKRFFKGIKNVDRPPVGTDSGLRLVNIDGVDEPELVVINSEETRVCRWDSHAMRWRNETYTWPRAASFLDEQGHDNGVRLRDLDGDGRIEILLSNQSEFAIYALRANRWIEVLPHQPRTRDHHAPESLPPFAVNGTNWGAWFHSDSIWWRNEFTGAMPDFVDRRAFAQLMGTAK